MAVHVVLYSRQKFFDVQETVPFLGAVPELAGNMLEGIVRTYRRKDVFYVTWFLLDIPICSDALNLLFDSTCAEWSESPKQPELHQQTQMVQSAWGFWEAHMHMSFVDMIKNADVDIVNDSMLHIRYTVNEQALTKLFQQVEGAG